MSEALTVKVSGRYQISLPSRVRRKLNIQAGDRLLVDVQNNKIILLPYPQNFTTYLAGLHKEVWEGIDTDAYLRKERDAWEEYKE